MLSELRKQPKLDIVETLKVKVYVAELVQCDCHFNDCAQRHLIIKNNAGGLSKSIASKTSDFAFSNKAILIVDFPICPDAPNDPVSCSTHES